VRSGLAAAAVAVTVGVAGVVVVPGLLGEDSAVTPADRDPDDPDDTAPAIIQGGGYRPAGFFRDVVGGSAVPSIARYYRTTPRIIFTARFEWSPDPAGVSYLGDLSLERYRSDAAQRCSRFVGGRATCTTRDDGSVVGRYEVPADGAFLAPVSEEGPLRLAESDGVLRGVTAFRTDGRAVTALACNCSSPNGDVLTEAPPVTFEALEDVVTDPSWGLRVGGDQDG
ncbi:hypothetical protein, partial [Nocardioides sp.]|uniref:hypothetical protein n=1 Tax=Nocardioides sp. TaxID=35761 RepID=UPI002B27A447